MPNFQPAPQTLEKFKTALLDNIDMPEGDTRIQDFVFGDGLSLDDLGTDSIGKFENINVLEETWDISMDDEEVNEAKNLDDILWLIAFKIKETDETPLFLQKADIIPKR